MKRIIEFGLTFIAATAFAQVSGPAEPDETEIVLPEFLLQVEELGVEELEAVLPGSGELALGAISHPLPGADELAVSDIAFDAPINAVAQRSAVSAGTDLEGCKKPGTAIVEADRAIGLKRHLLGRFRVGCGQSGLCAVDTRQHVSQGVGIDVDGHIFAVDPKGTAYDTLKLVDRRQR